MKMASEVFSKWWSLFPKLNTHIQTPHTKRENFCCITSHENRKTLFTLHTTEEKIILKNDLRKKKSWTSYITFYLGQAVNVCYHVM